MCMGPGPQRVPSVCAPPGGDGETGIVEGAAQEWSIPLVTDSIRSDKWWAYSAMIHELHLFSADFTAWAEGCSCHFWLKAAGGRLQAEGMALAVTREALMLPPRVGDGPHCGPCPLAGMRAVELATGALPALFNELAQQHLEELMPSTAGISDADLQLLLVDFSAGRAAMSTYLQQKLQCWGTLPWKFAALAHDDEEQARSFAREILTEFDRLNGASCETSPSHGMPFGSLRRLGAEMRHHPT